MAEDVDNVQPFPGMVISVLTREDVVVVDPQRFLAAARRAFLADNPDAGEDEAAGVVTDVYEAAHALIERYGSLASEHPDVAAGATARRRMSGGAGWLPGDRVRDRPDGLSPAGTVSQVEAGAGRSLQDYGCWLPEPGDLFTEPLHRAVAD
jgi:hypothetical protein